MKIKLDENLPEELADLLAASGHDVHTVRGESLIGRDDQTVLSAPVRGATGSVHAGYVKPKGISDRESLIPTQGLPTAPDPLAFADALRKVNLTVDVSLGFSATPVHGASKGLASPLLSSLNAAQVKVYCCGLSISSDHVLEPHPFMPSSFLCNKSCCLSDRTCEKSHQKLE